MKAFWILSTERSFGFYAGPIPHSKIREYGREKQLRGDLLDMFVSVIMALDSVFLEDAEEQRKENKPPAVKEPEIKTLRRS